MSQTVPVSCPSKSNRKTADNKAQPWTYSPGTYPELDAALDLQAATYGTIWSPHLLGPGDLPLSDFLISKEVIAQYPVGSNARYVIEELRALDCFGGSRRDSKRALTAHIKQSTLFQRCGNFRHVQRIFNSIWGNYQGLLAAKQANLKALLSLQDKQLRADERRIKDTARKAAARSGDPAVNYKKSLDQCQRLRNRAAVERALAKKKQAKAAKLLAEADTLNAAAAARDERAALIEKQPRSAAPSSAGGANVAP
jgi:hypothetical protein